MEHYDWWFPVGYLTGHPAAELVVVMPFSYTLRTNSIQAVTHFIFKLI